jgi:hypothetical protein
MVEIETDPSSCTVRVLGWHRYWCFKGELTVHHDQLSAVGPVPEDRDTASLLSLRIPGVHIPWVIKAGSYYWNGEWEFWDVTDVDRSIVLELDNHEYDRLVVEVENPESTIRRLRAFLNEKSPDS